MASRTWLAAIVAAAMISAGCSSSAATSTSGQTCAAGAVVKYDTVTGKPYCASATDVGLSDLSTSADTGGAPDSAVPADAATKPDAAVDAQPGADAGTDVAKTDPFQCPPETANPALGKHGQACTQNSDCMYGVCAFGAPLAGYDAAIGFCTKNCSCTGPAAVCSTDDGGMDDTFKCVMEKTIQSGNPKRDAAKPVSKMCARVCQKDVDCAAWNPALPDCLQVSNLYVSVPAGVCGKKQP